MLLAPALTQPLIAIGLVGGLVAVWLAWKSVAYPLALAGIPGLVSAIAGSNPLPKGGATFLVAAWIGLAVLFATLRGHQEIPLRGLMTVPVALSVVLLGLMLLRLGPSPGQAYGSTKIQLFVADNLVFLVGAVFVGADRRSVRLFLILTLAIVAAGAFLLLGRLLGGAAQQQYAGRFTISAQEGAINLGRASATGALISIYVILASTSARLRLAALVVLPVVVVSLVAAGSRGPTLAFAVGLVVLLGLTAASGRARRQLLIVMGAIVAAVVVVPVVVPGSAIGRSLSTIIGSASGLSSNGRSHLWAEAYAAIGLHPFIGLGTGGFAAVDPQQYPHNLLLEMGAELGIIGAVAVAVTVGVMGQRLAVLWRRALGTERLEVTVLIALFVTALVNSMFSGAVQDNYDVWLWGGIGLGLYARGQAGPARVRRRADPRAF